MIPMYGIQVDEKSRTAVVGMLNNARKRLSSLSVEAMRDAVEEVYVAAQDRCPRDQGDLQASMRRYLSDIRPSQGVLEGKITMRGEGGQLAYAWMREMGGTIRPRPENPIQRLVWMDKDTSRLVFARQVTQKGSHYMSGALAEKKEAVLNAFTRTAAKICEGGN